MDHKSNKSGDALVVIQARTNSSRLPGKVLMDVGGLPLAVMAARRAARLGHRVVVATSCEASDDILAETLERHGIACYRGALDDVLGRFAALCAGLADETVLLRLTGDNMVPDGELIAEMIEYFEREGLHYLSTGGLKSGLPRGVGIEVMRVGDIRLAAATTKAPYDREHVTPWIIRHHGMKTYDRHEKRGQGHYRITVDNIDDYLTIRRLVAEVADPVAARWDHLLDLMRPGKGQPLLRAPAEGLVLDVSALSQGEDEHPALSSAAQQQLLRLAVTNGVTGFRAARETGSEESIGRLGKSGWSDRYETVTSLAPLADLIASAAPETLAQAVRVSVLQSCIALNQSRLGTVLLHRAADLTAQGGVIAACLSALRDEGVIARIGVPVETPQELAAALSAAAIGHIELAGKAAPDLLTPELEAARAERGLVVHIRCDFAQSLALAGAASRDAAPDLTRLRSQNRIDALVISVAKEDQFLTIAERFVEA